jgi:hypothetical protein
VNDKGKIGVRKTYLFFLAFSSYTVLLTKNEFHISVMVMLSVVATVLSFAFYRATKGWVLATIVPFPFLFATVFVVSKDTLGLEHYLTRGAGALCVLSIFALTIFALLHNLDKSMEEDR